MGALSAGTRLATGAVKHASGGTRRHDRASPTKSSSIMWPATDVKATSHGPRDGMVVCRR